MDFSCPNCGCSLKREPPKSVPLPGQRTLLPLKSGFACAACNRRVAMNFHPVEVRVRFADLGTFGLLSLLAYCLDDSRLFHASVLISGLSEIGLWLWSRNHLQSWRRYVLVDQP